MDPLNRIFRFGVVLVSICAVGVNGQYGGGGYGGGAYGAQGYGGGSSYGGGQKVAAVFNSRPFYAGGIYFPPSWTFGFPGAPIFPFGSRQFLYGSGGNYGGGGYGGGGYGGGGGGFGFYGNRGGGYNGIYGR